MKRKGQNIFFGIPKIIILLVYLPFFLVQGFFNYYSPASNNHKQVKASYNKTVSHLAGTTLLKSAKVTGKQSSIRLNKRFQPATAPLCIVDSFELPYCYREAKSFPNYPNPLLSSFHLIVQTLRGPPVVA